MHTKDTDSRVVIHKQATEMINEVTANGLGREDIQHNFCDAWKVFFREEWLGLDGNGIFGVRDIHKELNDAEKEDSDFTGGNVDGAAGSADGLNNDDSMVIDTEENQLEN